MTPPRGLLALEPGLLTTVQDIGRHGWAASGVPVAGALDEEALRLANLLVGNAEGAAALEITLVGPVLRVSGALDVAVVGGSFGPAPGSVLSLADGEVLSLAAARGAARAIVAASGGFDVPVVLGSRSTCLSARFGGFQGRRLWRGDFLAVAPPSSPPLLDASVDLVEPAGDVVLRAFAGPDEAEFDAKQRAAFWGSRWRILPESNRMGLRLGGPSLGLQETASRASEGTTAGTVQVTADGHPIVLLAERPTTGGYPKLAVVAAVDLGLLARTPPGRSVRFERIPVTEARSLLVARDVRLRSFPGGRT
ncbi:MAG: biotin-dependent carboxyltransferase family protein [Thermoanaerobaculia bacterium]|nr:biotin-dependent carboxyltransferase family protein [Thermoanaerobaculia bacterium]